MRKCSSHTGGETLSDDLSQLCPKKRPTLATRTPIAPQPAFRGRGWALSAGVRAQLERSSIAPLERSQASPGRRRAHRSLPCPNRRHRPSAGDSPHPAGRQHPEDMPVRQCPGRRSGPDRTRSNRQASSPNPAEWPLPSQLGQGRPLCDPCACPPASHRFAVSDQHHLTTWRRSVLISFIPSPPARPPQLPRGGRGFPSRYCR